MKLILIAAVIAECVLLAVLTLFKKWTKKAFMAVSVLTALCCAGIVGVSVGGQIEEGSADQREHLYMAARLIEEDYAEQTLEVLSEVTDEALEQYNARPVRALSYNLNGAYSTAEEYLRSFDGGELEEIIRAASEEKTPVEDDAKQRAVTETLDAIAATETESMQWEAEMKVRYMGFHLTEDEMQNVTSLPGRLKAAIQEHDYRQAYEQAAEAAGDYDIKNAVLVSSMYVNNYDRRAMAETDSEYASLWNEAAQLQADLNLAALNLPKEDAEESDADETGSDEAYQEYQVIRARYELALDALDQESIKRAINYLNAFESENSQFRLGKQLQLARLYFMSNQIDEAKEYIYDIFTAEQLDDTQWLGKEIAFLRNAVINYISDSTNAEYSVLFDKLMDSLYQGVYEDDSYDSFKEFTISCLRDIFGGLIVKRVDTAAFPQIVAEVSVTNPEIQVNNSSLSITDTGEDISGYSVEAVEVNDLSLSLVLDCSGSMAGSKLSDSKDAIRNCILQMDDAVRLSFVTFENTAALECGLTDSKYLVMSLVEGARASGGTNISAGLSAAVESLRGASGSKVIILLSDGADFDESKAIINNVLTDAAANQVTIYTIGLRGCEEDYLQMIADRTGGQFIMVTNVSELDRTYRDIQNALMNTYRITYTVSDESESRSVIMKENSSFVEARKHYSTEEEDRQQNAYTGGLQQAGYYTQTGGTDLGG